MSVRSEVRKATKAVGKALTPEPAAVEDTDILDTLKKEHDEVKDLLADLQDAEGGEQRSRLVLQIKQALVPHTKAEEKVVYDRVIALRDKEAQTATSNMNSRAGHCSVSKRWAPRPRQSIWQSQRC